jgi:hypothetical protein
VLDQVFGALNPSQVSKTFAVANSLFSEIWWFYPDADDTENSRYVSYNYVTGVWAIGALSRTCGVDRGVFNAPIWFDATGQGYDHETGQNRGGAAVFAESGPLSIGAGDQVMSVLRLVPDEGTQGGVTATFKARFYPNAVETSYGPYTMAAPTNVRFTGRQVKMRLDGVAATDWRVGTMRVDAVARGLR